MSTLRYLWRRHPVALTGFVLAAVVVLAFAVRIVAGVIYWRDPAHRMATPEGWMTPGYIGHSWHMTRDEVVDLLALTPAEVDRRLSLDELARERGLDPQAFLRDLAETLDAREGSAPR